MRIRLVLTETESHWLGSEAVKGIWREKDRVLYKNKKHYLIDQTKSLKNTTLTSIKTGRVHNVCSGMGGGEGGLW